MEGQKNGILLGRRKGIVETKRQPLKEYVNLIGEIKENPPPLEVQKICGYGVHPVR